MTVVAMGFLLCHNCDHRICPDALCTIQGTRRDVLLEMERLHFCSTLCWITWFATMTPTEWVTIVLPVLTTTLDVRDVHRAFAGRPRKLAA